MSEPLFNLSQIEALADGNQEFVTKMVKMFVDLTPEMVNLIDQSIKLQDWDQVKATAHKLKPSIDMMGVAQLSPMIRKIESLAKEQENLEELPGLFETFSEIMDQVIGALSKH